MSKSRLMVVGYGRMGRKFAKVFTDAFDVHVYSRRDVGDDIAESGCTPVADFKSCAASSDYVFLAVPVFELEGYVQRLNGCIRKDACVFEMCSARISAESKMRKLKCRWFGMHAGGCFGDPDPQVLEFMAGRGIRFKRMSAEEHDRRNSVIAMAHFVGMALDDLINEEDREVLETSPAARNLLALVDHLKDNAPATYWESQVCNPFTGRRRRRLIDSFAEYSDRLDRGDFPFAPELSNSSC